MFNVWFEAKSHTTIIDQKPSSGHSEIRPIVGKNNFFS